MTKYRDADRSCLLMLPHSVAGRAWLYAVVYEDGTVKVGQTWKPRSRATQHLCRHAGERGVRFHLFESVPAERATLIEAEILRIAATIGRRIGRTERFERISFDRLLACVREVIARARSLVAEGVERGRYQALLARAAAHNVAVGVYAPARSTAVH